MALNVFNLRHELYINSLQIINTLYNFCFKLFKKRNTNGIKEQNGSEKRQINV